MVEWWAPAHSTGWYVKVCRNCNKIVARKTKCATCSKEIIEGADIIKDVSSRWYCDGCAPDAEEEEKKMILELKKIDKILPDFECKLIKKCRG